MVQPIENKTRLLGQIVARQPHPTLRDYDLVTLNVETAERVEQLPDLLNVQPGGRVEVAVPRNLLGDAGMGARLQCRAKFTPNGPMCEPHPEPGDFSVS